MAARRGGHRRRRRPRGYTLPHPATPGDSGARFRVVVSNEFGRTISPETTLAVTCDQPPRVEILSPAEGAAFVPGSTVSFTASAIDPASGPLPATSLVWRVDHLHNDHTHSYIAPTSGLAVLSFEAPAAPAEPGVHRFRVFVSTTDATGLSTTTYRDFIDARLAVTGRVAGRRTAAGIATRTSRPVVTGSASPGATVELFARDASGVERRLGQAVANRRGRWAIRARRLPTGPHRITARATDRAGASAPARPLWAPGEGTLIV
jgi:hypothetical protein